MEITTNGSKTNIIIYIKYVKYNKYTNPIDFRKSTIIKEAGKRVWCENVKRAKNFRNLGAFRFSSCWNGIEQVLKKFLLILILF